MWFERRPAAQTRETQPDGHGRAKRKTNMGHNFSFNWDVMFRYILIWAVWWLPKYSTIHANTETKKILSVIRRMLIHSNMDMHMYRLKCRSVPFILKCQASGAKQLGEEEREIKIIQPHQQKLSSSRSFYILLNRVSKINLKEIKNRTEFIRFALNAMKLRKKTIVFGGQNDAMMFSLEYFIYFDFCSGSSGFLFVGW